MAIGSNHHGLVARSTTAETLTSQWLVQGFSVFLLIGAFLSSSFLNQELCHFDTVKHFVWV